jgi:hypothetical protein
MADTDADLFLFRYSRSNMMLLAGNIGEESGGD